jgi:FtsH-binding integral membrane protein
MIMDGNLRFGAFIFVALFVFVIILRVVLRARSEQPSWMQVITIAYIVVAGGMLFAKFGQNGGLPWWIYYAVPMLVTVLVLPGVEAVHAVHQDSGAMGIVKAKNAG